MNVEKVLVFGYSANVDRYSNMAYSLLNNYAHETIAFNPRLDSVDNLPASCDTVTMYVSEEISNKFFESIVKIKFKRIIFNPGTENMRLENFLKEKGVEIVHGCTLVMLKTSQFS